MKIDLFCPSRDRINKVLTFICSVATTAKDINNINLVLGVDDDDPKRDIYLKIAQNFSFIQLVEFPANMFKEKGLVDKIGVSIYDPDELNILEDSGIKLDIVQTPFNMLDRRIETSGWLNKLSQNGTEVHSRSVFLQGLLLQDKNHRNPYFSKWRNYFNKLDSWIYDTKQTSLSAALNFSYSYKDINKLLVGVQNKLQLTEIINSISQDYSHSLPEELRIDDPLLINPTNWRL